MKNLKLTILALTMLILLGNITAAKAQTNLDTSFNPNRILEDSDILNYGSMNLNDIQNFLRNKGGYLSNYTTTNTHGDQKTAAEIIYDATYNNYDCDGVTLSDQPTEAEKKLKCRSIKTVNPKLILMLLQKEASLIEDVSPSAGRLDWATGYGCPTNWVCNPYYKGFGKQVNSASLQFLAYMQEPGNYNFKVGQTYIAKDKYSMLKPVAKSITDGDYNTIVTSPGMVSVTPQNQATAALYNYTPHVYNGNYNVYKLWQRYFPKISRLYPDGSLIKGEGDPRVWLIEGGKKRLFITWSSFISRFKPEQIVTVTPSELENYPLGDEIKFANYALVEAPDKTIYLLVGQEKRPFASLAVFKKIGFNPEEIEKASSTDLVAYTTGKTITATTTYITGALLQDNKTKEIYYVEGGIKNLVNPQLMPIKFTNRKIISKTSKDLAVYQTGAPIRLDEGTLARTSSFPTVYLISGGKKRPFNNDASFTALGYNPANILTVSSQILYEYDMGDPIIVNN